MRSWIVALCLIVTAAAAQAQTLPPGLSVWFAFDEGTGRFTREQKSGALNPIASPHHEVEWVAGVRGTALRLDGYSNYVARPLPDSLQPTTGLTVELWTAVEAYPVTNAPFVNQYTYPGAGYFFGMDKLGRWYLAVSVGGQWVTCWAADPFPKNRWVHAAGTFDAATGQLRVFLNGQVVGSATAPKQALTPDRSTTLTIGRDVHTPKIGIFETGLLNGIVDEVKVYRRALSEAEVYTASRGASPQTAPDLSVPESRVSADLQRPRYHALPPAAWTNEPHGLVYWKGAYHLFYQKNPNGPYWEQIHWGHMKSTDLVVWEHLPIALAPEAGWDQRGIWSGDAVVHNDRLALVYTGVDGAKAGMGLAISVDPLGKIFQKVKSNPVVPATPPGTLDFRDPFVWKEGSTWYMIIGAGIPGAGGTALLYTSPDLNTWTYRGPLYTGAKATSGIFWEMPVLLPIGNGKHILEVTTVEENPPARGLYWIGTWDGTRFVPDDPTPKAMDLVNHMLSPAVEIDPQGRLVAMGIVPEMRGSEAQLSAGWAHVFSLPRVWTLCADGATLCQAPLPELARLREATRRFENVTLLPGSTGHLAGVAGRRLEIDAELDPGTATTVGLVVLQSPDGQERTRIFYNTATKALTVDLSMSSLSGNVRKNVYTVPYTLPEGQPLRLHVFVDHSVLEVFTGDGKALSLRVYPTLETSTGADLMASGGTAVARRVDAWALKEATSAALGAERGEHPALPSGLRIESNYPNPFHPSTTVRYALDAPARARLSVYDSLGRRVDTLVDAMLPAGWHEATWDGTDRSGRAMPSGVYFCRLESDGGAVTHKMTLLR